MAEESDETTTRAMLTERARAEICRRVMPAQHSVAQTARDPRRWPQRVTTADRGSITSPGSVHTRRSGLDETSFVASTADHPTLLVTGVIDLDAGRLIDVLPARSAVAVTNWLGSKPAPWLAGIRHVVTDPYQPYAAPIADGLPDARLVVDHFHVIRLAKATLDEVRRRTPAGHRRTPGTQARSALPDPPTPFGRPRTTQPSRFARVLAYLDAGDP